MAANESDSMPEPLNEVPAKSGKKRGRGACAPANRRPFRTLDGTKQAKVSAGEFLVLFAAKKYKETQQSKTAFATFCHQKVAIPLGRNPPFSNQGIIGSGYFP